MSNTNYEGTLEKIRKEQGKWEKQMLDTPFGRISLIKTLLLSKLTHLVMSPAPAKILQEVNNLMLSVLWYNRSDKI